MTEPIRIKYSAFISYSHHDTRWGKWLQRKLEHFPIGADLVGRETAMGPVPKTLAPVFRDRDEFTPGHTLKDQTLAALEASAALIVVASPHSAKSHYVNEEVRLFRMHHPDRPVVPMIVEGAPGAGELECFPEALRFSVGRDGSIGQVPEEILAADARDEADGQDLAVAKVAARLIGLPTDEVFRRAERDRRQRLRRWIGGLVTVALIMGGLAVFAWLQRQASEHRAQILERDQNAMLTFVSQGIAAHVARAADLAGAREGLRDPPDYDRLIETSAFAADFLPMFRNVLRPDSKSPDEIGSRLPSLDYFDADREMGPEAQEGALAVVYTSMGDMLRFDVKRRDDVQKNYAGALSLRQRVADRHPENKDAQRLLAVALGRVALVAAAAGETIEARQSLGRAIAILEPLAAGAPDEVTLAAWKTESGDQWLTQQRLEKSAPALRAARELQRLQARLADLPE